MHYLLQSLQGTAYSLVANVEITDTAFATAWQTLTTRYEKKRVLITAQLNKLFSIPEMASRAAKEVNNIINTTSEVLNALKALGSPVDHWDHIIVHYIT
ncbi:GSCOCG00011815001-RA-CDS [Cotesia congregata]|nr:GSCOCG00011815001-RA-CDS [Cotesia congregata]